MQTLSVAFLVGIALLLAIPLLVVGYITYLEETRTWFTEQTVFVARWLGCQSPLNVTGTQIGFEDGFKVNVALSCTDLLFCAL